MSAVEGDEVRDEVDVCLFLLMERVIFNLFFVLIFAVYVVSLSSPEV
jgi:hypothetical protein